MSNGNGVDHALVSEASREMGRPPHEKMRFESYSEEYRFLCERIVCVEGHLRELNVREHSRKIDHFRHTGGSDIYSAHQWSRVKHDEFGPERLQLTAELTSLRSRQLQIKDKAKRDQAVEHSQLFRANGTVNHDKAFLEILGSLAKLTRAVEGLSRRLDAIESRGLMEAPQ